MCRDVGSECFALTKGPVPLRPEGLLPRAVPIMGVVQGTAVSLLGQRDSGVGRREGQNPDARYGFVQVGLQGWTQQSAFRFWVVERERRS